MGGLVGWLKSLRGGTCLGEEGSASKGSGLICEGRGRRRCDGVDGGVLEWLPVLR